MASGGKRPPVPDGGKTMQLDALVDELEEVAPPPGLGHGETRPPPLPPKKTSKGMLVVGIVIVLLAAGLGIGAGAYLMGTPDAPPPEALTDPPRPGAPADPDRSPYPPEADEGSGEAGDDSDVVQLDEVLVGAE